MNSVSESLYMATPMALYPQTNEQRSVSRRVSEKGAGLELKDDSAEGIKTAVFKILNNKSYAASAKGISEDFRSCGGVEEAADFILSALHTSNGVDLIKETNKDTKRFQLCYWSIVITLIVLLGLLVSWRFVWIIGVLGGVMNYPISTVFQKKRYDKLAQKHAHNDK